MPANDTTQYDPDRLREFVIKFRPLLEDLETNTKNYLEAAENAEKGLSENTRDGGIMPGALPTVQAARAVRDEIGTKTAALIEDLRAKADVLERFANEGEAEQQETSAALRNV